MAEHQGLTIDVVDDQAVQRTLALLRVAQEIIRKRGTVEEQQVWSAAVDRWVEQLECRALDASGHELTSKN